MTLAWQSGSEPELHRFQQAGACLLPLAFGRPRCVACLLAGGLGLAAGRVARLIDFDTQSCAGRVREHEVFRLPAIFLWPDGLFHTPLAVLLTAPLLADAVERAFTARAPEAP